MPNSKAAKAATFDLLWKRALAAGNTAAIENLVKARVYQKPRKPVYKKPAVTSTEQVLRSNQQKAWLRNSTAWQKNMNRAEQHVVQSRMNMKTLKYSTNPAFIAFALKRGADVRSLTVDDIQNRVHALRHTSPRYSSVIDAHLLLMTAAINARVKLGKTDVVDVVNTVFELIDEIGEIRSGHVTLLRAMERQGYGLGDVFAEMITDWRLIVTWDEFLQVLQKILPSDPAARSAFNPIVSAFILSEGVSEESLRDLASLIPFNTSTLENVIHQIFMATRGRYSSFGVLMIKGIPALQLAAPFFQADMARLSRASLRNIVAKHRLAPNAVHVATVTRELERLKLLEPARRSPSRRSTPPGAKRRRTR